MLLLLCPPSSDEALELLRRTQRHSGLVLAETQPLHGELEDATARAYAAMGESDRAPSVCRCEIALVRLNCGWHVRKLPMTVFPTIYHLLNCCFVDIFSLSNSDSSHKSSYFLCFVLGRLFGSHTCVSGCPSRSLEECSLPPGEKHHRHRSPVRPGQHRTRPSALQVGPATLQWVHNEVLVY